MPAFCTASLLDKLASGGLVFLRRVEKDASDPATLELRRLDLRPRDYATVSDRLPKIPGKVRAEEQVPLKTKCEICPPVVAQGLCPSVLGCQVPF
jgi:hypothetical protein